MLYRGPGDDLRTDVHEGYVAGRYRDGSWTDIWTDVARCAEGTFTVFAPACECGWRGSEQPATPKGHAACRRRWVRDHFELPPEIGSLCSAGVQSGDEPFAESSWLSLGQQGRARAGRGTGAGRIPSSSSAR